MPFLFFPFATIGESQDSQPPPLPVISGGGDASKIYKAKKHAPPHPKSRQPFFLQWQGVVFQLPCPAEKRL